MKHEILSDGSTSPVAFKRVRFTNGLKGIKDANGRTLPLPLMRLCVGRDKWVSMVTFKCEDCGETFPARDLNEGGWCEECQYKDIED